MSIEEIIVTASVAILSVCGAAYFTVRQFFLEREYQLVKERYLEGSIDLLAAQLQEAIQSHKYNWAKSLTVLKQFRDFERNFDFEKLNICFIEVKSANFNIIAQYRLNELTGTDKFWTAYQLALAFVYSSEAFINDDFLALLRLKSGKDFTEEERKEVVALATEKLTEQNREIDKYFVIFKHFHKISKIFEQEKMTFKNIETFKDRPEVIAIVRKIEELFGAEVGTETEST